MLEAMKRTKRNNKWFVKVRGSYIPNNSYGWLTYIPYLAFVVAVPLYVFSHVDNRWLGLLIIIPNYVAAGVVMTWLAAHES